MDIPRIESKIIPEVIKEIVLGSETYFPLLFGKGISEESLESRARELGKVQVNDLVKLCSLSLEENKTSGLKIGDQVINRLSGPCSFRLFTPKYKHLPVIICLGDLHNTITGMCETCVCHSLEDCCYKSFDPTFLRHLDVLSSSEQPLDIYIETFLNQTNQAQLNPYKIAELQKQKLEDNKQINQQLYSMKLNYLPCMISYRTGDLKQVSTNRCPTSNIRWHFSDPRVNILQTSDTTGIVFENAMMDFVTNAYRFQYKDSFLQNVYDKRPEYLDYLKKCFLLAFTDTDAYLSQWLSEPYSKTAKQFSKLSSELKERVRPYLLEYIYHIRNIVTKDNKQTIETLCMFLQNNLNQNSPDIQLSQMMKDQMFYVMIEMVSVYLDIYAYLRLLKVQPRPWCCIMVMGEKHCRNMSHFFTSILDQYTLQVSIGEPYVTFTKTKVEHHHLKAQCIDFSSHFINLNGLRQFYTGDETFLYQQIENTHEKFTGSNSRMLYNLRRILFSKDYDNTVETLLYNKQNYLKDFSLSDSDSLSRLCRLDDFEKEVKWITQFAEKKRKWNRKEQLFLEESLKTINKTSFILEAFLCCEKFDSSFRSKMWPWITQFVSPTIDLCNKVLYEKRSRTIVIDTLLNKSFHLTPNVYTFEYILKDFKKNPNEIALIKKCIIDYNIPADIYYLDKVSAESPELKETITKFILLIN
jgi:hypothetical protein